MSIKRVDYGQYYYNYQLLKEERKSMKLVVKPDLSIILKTPLQADQEYIDSFLRRKWLWLNKQYSVFGKYKKNVRKKEYVSGESFFYLGKQYQLVVKRGKEECIVLDREKLFVYTIHSINESAYTKNILNKWYRKKAREIFIKRLQKMVKKIGYTNVPELSVRSMNRRWGSYISKKKIILNSSLIHTSIDCIDYVITHELCHFQYKNHGKKFFALLDEKYPGWEKVKEKLEFKYGYIDIL